MKSLKFIIGVVAIIAATLTTQAQSFITNGLVAYFPFNGNANDASGNGNNGTATGIIYTANMLGVSNSAACFNGTNSSIAIPTLNNSPYSPITYSFWMNINAFPPNLGGQSFSISPIVGREQNYYASFGELGIATEPTAPGASSAPGYTNALIYWTGGGGNVILNPTAGIWQHIVVTLTNEVFTCYLNGQMVYTNAFDWSQGDNLPFNIGNTPDFNNGFTGWYGSAETPYNGCLTDIRIYSRALNGDDVAALYALESNPTTPPSITNQPSDVIAYANSNATFNVAATGNLPMAYQWQFNGTNLLNATNSTLNIVVAKQVNVGQYTVAITNSYGSITSSVANLFMYPYLNRPFVGVDTYWGQTNTLTVGAWGSGNLAYQWYFNGVALDGATNAMLPLGAIQFASAGQYNVVVSSSLGGVTNAPYSVVVNPANVSLGLFAGVIIQGTVGYNYNIQATTDLSNTNSWQTVTNITLASPIQIWSDYSSDVHNPNSPQKFYQVVPGQ